MGEEWGGRERRGRITLMIFPTKSKNKNIYVLKSFFNFTKHPLSISDTGTMQTSKMESFAIIVNPLVPGVHIKVTYTYTNLQQVC